jgi:hypothetical protein
MLCGISMFLIVSPGTPMCRALRMNPEILRKWFGSTVYGM